MQWHSSLMYYALPQRAGHFLALMVCGFLIVSCNGPVDDSSAPATEPAHSTDAIESIARTLATGTTDHPSLPTATISESLEGGASGEWGVRVDFPVGTGHGCTIDVIDRKSGDLLARDNVTPTGSESQSHVVRFRHRGLAKNLHIRVNESESGAVLAEVVSR